MKNTNCESTKMLSHEQSTFCHSSFSIPSLHTASQTKAYGSNAYSSPQSSLNLIPNTPSRLKSPPVGRFFVCERYSHDILEDEISENTLPYTKLSPDIKPFRPKLDPRFYHTPVQQHNENQECRKLSDIASFPCIPLKRILSADTLETEDSSFCSETSECSTPVHSPAIWDRITSTEVISFPTILRHNLNRDIDILATCHTHKDSQGLLDFPDSLQIPDLDSHPLPSSILFPPRRKNRLSMKPRRNLVHQTSIDFIESIDLPAAENDIAKGCLDVSCL